MNKTFKALTLSTLFAFGTAILVAQAVTVTADPLLSGTDGPLVVNGTTVTITPSVKRYSSVSITNGGTLNIVGDGSWMIMGVAGNLTVDSTSKIRYNGVTSNTSDDSGASATAPDGTVLSYTSRWNSGGRGGDILCNQTIMIEPGHSESTDNGNCGAPAAHGNGGGGAAFGNLYTDNTTATISAGGKGADGSAGPYGACIGGAGGTSGSPSGQNGTNCMTSAPYMTNGAGGGGGYRGTNGGALYIKTGGTVAFAGSIDVSGTMGGNGGKGGNSEDSPGSFGGGGGGGAAGGNGGAVYIVTSKGASPAIISTPTNITVNVSGSSGSNSGAGGLANTLNTFPGPFPGAFTVVNGDPGEPGEDGTDGTFNVFNAVDSAPTNVRASSISATSITWAWQAASQVESYVSMIDQSANSGWTSNTSWNQSSLSPNTLYQISVKSRNSHYLTETISASSSAYTAAPAPTGLSVGGSSTSTLTISATSFANDSSGQSGYYFSGSNSHSSGWIQTNTWKDSSLACGQSYSYTVKYRNQAGVETALSSSVSGSTSACPIAKTITLTSPAPNSIFYSGASITIPMRWTSQGITGVAVDFRTENGSSGISSSLIGNPGTYDFLLPASQAPGRYFVRVRGNDNASSTVYFTIASPASSSTPLTVKATLTLSSPAAGASFIVGSTIPIRWTSTNVSTTSRIYIDIQNPSKGSNLFSKFLPTNSGSYAYVIAPSIPIGSYAVRIGTDANTITSIVPITITAPRAPSATLIYPAPSYSYSAGTSIPVQWISQNMIAANSVYIEIKNASGDFPLYAGFRPNSGSFNVPIPPRAPSGTYTIKIGPSSTNITSTLRTTITPR